MKTKTVKLLLKKKKSDGFEILPDIKINAFLFERDR